MAPTCSPRHARVAWSPGLWHPDTVHPCLPKSSLPWWAGKGGTARGTEHHHCQSCYVSLKYQAWTQAASKAWTCHIQVSADAWAVQSTTELRKRCVEPCARTHTKAKHSTREATRTTGSLPSTAWHHHRWQRIVGKLLSLVFRCCNNSACLPSALFSNPSSILHTL